MMDWKRKGSWDELESVWSLAASFALGVTNKDARNCHLLVLSEVLGQGPLDERRRA